MGFLLAENGETKTDVIVSSEADRVVRFAAKELRDYLKKISGAEFRVREVPAGPAFPDKNVLRLGRPESAGAPGLDVPKSDADAFAISGDAGGVRVAGKNGRSVLYGVYELLEKLGCRFIEPGLEIVPAKRRLEVPKLRVATAAAFSSRNIFRIQILKSKTAPYEGLEPGHHLPQIDWMAKRKLNRYVFYIDYYRYDLWVKYKRQILDALLDRGFDIEVTHHSLHYFCPPDENHDYGDYGDSTYRHNHPDWYEGEQTRIDKREVRDIVIARYLDYVRNNPELVDIGLWPADTTMNSSPAGYLDFWNEVGAALAAEFPRKRLSVLAYLEILEPPKGAVPAPNLRCWYCPIRSNYMYPMNDARNRQYLDYMKAWIDIMPPGQVAAFEYYGWQSELTPFIEKMRMDLGAYRDLGLGGVYGWSGFTFNLMGTDFRWARDLYVFSRFLWDPDQETAALEADWAQGVFGAAAPAVMDFYRTLKQAHDREKNLGLLSRQSWISLDLLHDLQKTLAVARDKAETPDARYRVDLLEQLAGRASAARVLREQPSSVYSCF